LEIIIDAETANGLTDGVVDLVVTNRSFYFSIRKKRTMYFFFFFFFVCNSLLCRFTVLCNNEVVSTLPDVQLGHGFSDIYVKKSGFEGKKRRQTNRFTVRMSCQL
jgi:hypothetical protein